MEALKVLGKDGCGPVLDVDLQKNINKAIEDGTDTVSITYALSKLSVVIPEMNKQKERTDAVEEVKAQVKAKGASMGASLDDECIRLSS